MWQKIKRWAKRALVVLVGLVGIGVLVFLLVFPRFEAADTRPFDHTAERIERGAYLVENVMFCLNCHSQRDWNRYAAPPVPGTVGRGAPLEMFETARYSANITPAGLEDWTDGEIARAITDGVDREGVPLHPFMPYDSYTGLAEEDRRSIVAYLRTMTPIEFEPPTIATPWVVRLLSRILPRPYEPVEPPDRADSVAYGRYLVEIAECNFCHRSDFSGGRSLAVPGKESLPVSNISPSATGIGPLTRDNFIGVFRAFASPESHELPATDSNTVMPWLQYAGMTDEDLAAIYDYLRTVPPIE